MLKCLEFLNFTFKPSLVQKFSGIKLYNALAFPILLFGREIWTLRKKRLTPIKKKFFRRTATYTIFDTKIMKKFCKS